jgi:RimJ/RimL family protein N-acetyltransferase
MEHPILPLPHETQRLILRPPSPAYATAIQEAVEESFADLHPWMPWAAHLQSLEETKAFLEQSEAKFHSGEDFAVSGFLRDTGQFALGTGLHVRNWDVPKFEIGYWCRTSRQRQGYTTEAVTALAQIAFLQMGAMRVEIRCDSRNQRSRRVAERAGFRLEAQLRADDRANNGSLRDTVIYALHNAQVLALE